MDALETTPVATPAPATPPPTPPPAAPAPMPMAEAQASDGGIVPILKNMNWIEVGFGVLGAAALYYAIYYYRYNINVQKSFQTEMQNKIDELNIKIADINSVIKKDTPTENPDPYASFIR